MLSFLKLAFSKAGAYIAVGVATLFAVLAALSKAKKAGIQEAVLKTKEKEVENVQKAAEVERKNSAAPADDRRKRLRDRWTVG